MSKSEVRPQTRAPRRRLSAPARRELIERAATQVFAERGYAGASIDEIARRSKVSPPIVYDHFDSKLDLFTRLLERTRDELLAMWVRELGGERRLSPEGHRKRRPSGDATARMERAFGAWATYVEQNRFASRMYFLEATGDPQARAAHREIQAQGRAALSAILGRFYPAHPAEELARDADGLEMAAETMRAGLAGLAIWWDEHPHVTRERIVETAMNVLWTGFERLQAD